jgi:hypothetical protein
MQAQLFTVGVPNVSVDVSGVPRQVPVPFLKINLPWPAVVTVLPAVNTALVSGDAAALRFGLAITVPGTGEPAVLPTTPAFASLPGAYTSPFCTVLAAGAYVLTANVQAVTGSGVVSLDGSIQVTAVKTFIACGTII